MDGKTPAPDCDSAFLYKSGQESVGCDRRTASDVSDASIVAPFSVLMLHPGFT